MSMSEWVERLQDELNEAQAEIERLRAMLADSISRETVIATELQRDEAREAARELYGCFFVSMDQEINVPDMKKRWPWLEEDAG